jgi:biotin carboxyl carrier protein
MARESEDQSLRIRRDHDAILRLADELLPALIAKLSASGLGEIEVREGTWKARLRKPVEAQGAHRPAKQAEPQEHAHGSHAGRKEERAPEPCDEPPADCAVAKSPGVGIYTPRKDLAVGMRVRSGDKIGVVAVLGIPMDVLAPVEGVIGSSLAEAGEAVEYGQELVKIELPEPVAAAAQTAATAGAGPR